MSIRLLCLVVVTMALSGCANLFTAYRPIATNGKSVAIDIYQRGIYSVTTGGPENAIRLCAEPSPDAMTALALSGGLTGSANLPAGPSTGSASATQAQLSAAFASGQSSANVGLRTQSIQLLRDSMYRACEAYLSGGLSQREFYLLQRRFQILTVGLLAIEQLTGAVRPSQATLAAFGSSGSGSTNTDSETQAIASAQAEHSAAATALATAKLRKSEADQLLADEKPKLVDAKTRKEDAERADPPDQAKVDEETTAYENEKKVNTGLVKEAAEKQIEQDRTQRELDAASAKLEARQEALRQAQARVRAGTQAIANLSGSSTLGFAATKEIGDAVISIVTTVLTQGGQGEACASVLEGFATETARITDPLYRDVVNICLAAKRADTAIQIDESKLPEDTKKTLKRQIERSFQIQ